MYTKFPKTPYSIWGLNNFEHNCKHHLFKYFYFLEMKTDLNLLLECLKFQMDNPESQKAALVTIYSICQENGKAIIYSEEIGGLMFVSNLAKCSKHSIVKEASLFTLGVLAESNVYCQQTLCTLELFEDVCASLSNEDSSVNLKRMSVYVFLVLVSNNKCGQNLARQAGCIDMLLLLFRESLPKDNMCLTSNVSDEYYQLWCSICSALCACANNPQNDENQKLCSSAFPQARDWLLQYTNPEIVRPICSLVGLTVASNSFAQGYFSSVGGLDTLADVFSQLVTNLQFRESDPKVAVAITKTLDACITDNPADFTVLHSIVSSLIKMLSHETLDKEDRFSIVLTLGHCTENCGICFISFCILDLSVFKCLNFSKEKINLALFYYFLRLGLLLTGLFKER
uniref:Telomere repeat binding bouquet formation protein 1 n=1 Tax=Leptobrachium leishanense TaxID=445787 RepID=A0A8C5MR84_9ANUR